ncbi:MAG: flagellar biosynthesis regulator FlaF, partial [Pseudolabrys sp.]
LWTIFVASVTSDANPLPEDIRHNVTHLGLYVLRRTLLILADPRPASLAVLIGLNRNLASGLLSLPESAH